jgi:hypothetical protein
LDAVLLSLLFNACRRTSHASAGDGCGCSSQMRRKSLGAFAIRPLGLGRAAARPHPQRLMLCRSGLSATASMLARNSPVARHRSITSTGPPFADSAASRLSVSQNPIVSSSQEASPFLPQAIIGILGNDFVIGMLRCLLRSQSRAPIVVVGTVKWRETFWKSRIDYS